MRVIIESLSASLSLKKLSKNPIAVMETLNLTQAKNLVSAMDDAYIEGDALVEDSIYDTIRDYIADRWPKSSLAKKIGAKSDADVKLPVPMASLNQFKLGTSTLTKALSNGKPKILSDKLDGLSIELVYEKGVPVSAFTRGDADSGKEVSHHIPSFNIPKKIPTKERFIVRCEALIGQKKFLSKMHKDVGGRFKSARPAASGLIRNFETKEEMKHVDLVCFGVIGGAASKKKQSDQFKLLKQYGFEVVRHFGPFTDLTEEKLAAHLETRMGKAKYELDGIVCTDDVPAPASTTSNPKHAFKFKMNTDADVVIATVEDIIYQESKYGVLSPVVVVSPVVVPGGITITRASGHNGYYIQHGYLKPKGKEKAPHEKRPLGIGSKVKLIRSNKVIPYIMEIIKPSSKPKLPSVPYTLDGVEFRATKRTDTGAAKLLESFMKGADYSQVGESTAKLLVDGGISTPQALILSSLKVLKEVCGDARGKQIVKDNKRILAGIELNTWLKAVSPYFMRGANTTFDKVVDQIPSLPTFLKKRDTTRLTDRIAAIHGVKTLAPKLADACIQGYELAQETGVTLKAPKKVVVKSTALSGIEVAFSGIRDADLKTKIVELGGTASDSMKASTNILIVKDPSSGSSKIQKAMDKGIPVLTIDQFKKKYKVM